jgi:hypothetical protein
MSSPKKKDEQDEGIHRSLLHIENDINKRDAQGESIDGAADLSPIDKLHDESVLTSPVSNRCCCHPPIVNAHNQNSNRQKLAGEVNVKSTPQTAAPVLLHAIIQKINARSENPSLGPANLEAIHHQLDYQILALCQDEPPELIGQKRKNSAERFSEFAQAIDMEVWLRSSTWEAAMLLGLATLTGPRGIMKQYGPEAVLEAAMVRWFERALGTTVEEVYLELGTAPTKEGTKIRLTLDEAVLNDPSYSNLSFPSWTGPIKAFTVLPELVNEFFTDPCMIDYVERSYRAVVIAQTQLRAGYDAALKRLFERDWIAMSPVSRHAVIAQALCNMFEREDPVQLSSLDGAEYWIHSNARHPQCKTTPHLALPSASPPPRRANRSLQTFPSFPAKTPTSTLSTGVVNGRSSRRRPYLARTRRNYSLSSAGFSADLNTPRIPSQTFPALTPTELAITTRLPAAPALPTLPPSCKGNPYRSLAPALRTP